MSQTLSISDDLAAVLEARRLVLGLASIDAAAEALIAQGLATDAEDHSAGRSDDQLRVLIEEADASGPPEAWDASAVRAEILRRYAARG